MTQKIAFPIRSVLALVCAASLVACGGGGSSATPSGTDQNGGHTGGTGGDTGGTGNTGGTAVTFLGLSISPGASALVLTAGDSVQLTARDRYSDATTRDRTQVVTWSSSNTSVLTISDAAGTKGNAVAVAAGVALVTAQDAETGATATINVVVTEAVIQGVVVSAADSSTPAGYGVQFTAEATYSDGVIADVTDLAAWSSSDDAVATVSNDPVSIGMAKGVAQGTATITATLPGGFAASAPLTVTAAVLQAITIGAPADRIPKSMPVQLTATASFSDSSTQDVTSYVTWSSSDPAIATVSNVEGSVGVVTGLRVGSATISVTNGSISASKTIEFTDAVMQSLSVAAAPSRPFTWVGTQTRFTAWGTFNDGTLLDVTRDVQWSVSPAELAGFSAIVGKTSVAWAYAASAAPVVVTATDRASGVTREFTWNTIRARHRQVVP